jgi:hypothetical protein
VAYLEPFLRSLLALLVILHLWARVPTLDAEFDKTGAETVFVVLFKKTDAGRVCYYSSGTPSSRRSSSRAASRARSHRERRCRTLARLPSTLRLDPHPITLGLFILVPYVTCYHYRAADPEESAVS